MCENNFISSILCEIDGQVNYIGKSDKKKVINNLRPCLSRNFAQNIICILTSVLSSICRANPNYIDSCNCIAIQNKNLKVKHGSGISPRKHLCHCKPCPLTIVDKF